MKIPDMKILQIVKKKKKIQRARGTFRYVCSKGPAAYAAYQFTTDPDKVLSYFNRGHCAARAAH